MGEEINSRRNPGDRMLDRYNRMLHEEIQKGDSKTPHLASVELNGAIHIAGNSGKKRVTKNDSSKAQERVLSVTEPGTKQDLKEYGDRYKKDKRKLLASRKGTYHPEDDNLRRTTETIVNGPKTWHQLDSGGKGSLHGEMALHEPILEYIKQKPQNEEKDSERIYIGGVKKDCLFCHWTHAILNEHLYAEHKTKVETSGTHGYPFPGWKAPKPLLDNKKALEAFEEKLKELNKIDDSGQWSINNGKVNKKEDKKPDEDRKVEGNSHNPEDSGSECESESE